LSGSGVTAICLPAAPWIIDLLSANKSPDFLSLTTALAYICMPQVFFYGLYSVLGQVLNAYGRFSAYAWAPAWANVIQIAGLAYFIREWGNKNPDPWTYHGVGAGRDDHPGIVVQGLCLIVP
jgi:putative peptidoglycan lipid II flippase